MLIAPSSSLGSLGDHSSSAQTLCNGHAEYCSRTYSNVSIVGAHNSYAVDSGSGALFVVLARPARRDAFIQFAVQLTSLLFVSRGEPELHSGDSTQQWYSIASGECYIVD